jgi:hypothetical protein
MVMHIEAFQAFSFYLHNFSLPLALVLMPIEAFWFFFIHNFIGSA